MGQICEDPARMASASPVPRFDVSNLGQRDPKERAAWVQVGVGKRG